MSARALPPALTRIPVSTNLLLAGLFTLINLGAIFAVPIFLLPVDPNWAWLLLPAVLTTPAFWALTHESVHGVLHPDKRVNNGMGRFLGWQFGAPFRVLRLGHLIHHKVNRTAMDRSEAWQPDKESWLARAGEYYFFLTIGLFLSEISALVLCWVPKNRLERVVRFLFRPRGEGAPDVRDWAVKQLVSEGRFWELRLDTTMIFILYGTGFWLYGEMWFLLLAVIAGRGFMISFLDNVYHYGTPLDNVRYSYNLALPGPLSGLILHFNYHRVHHRFPNVPWRALPAVHAEKDGGFEQGFATAAMRQLKGPIRIDALPTEPAPIGNR